MTLYQIILLTALGIFFLKQLVSIKKTSGKNFFRTYVWLILTFAGATVIADPRLTAVLAQKFGIGRGTDIVVYTVIGWLFYKMYRADQQISKQQEQLNKLVSRMALKDTNEQK
ncbi:DUF2304 domain-containing protein [Candidatus Nomurabacteria bacterium]|uniref:DUF2304 domain-containing protein n=1 Tax=candidate division WWE3 bacterium TaxID=2053526 RepID=A0A955E201_UNCKA|nr:DUF2304 domain-containing protein [candidate division WWE3 bacterium]MCB9823446.1 DUF2304 domain-containing protein [Candidatus Nomurabacteria bacterium]MCB9827728.1 DUF2304 domain-containing protein [Candidatus Nomurabacteria bacterium]HXK52774.1 DUF2304 domain-containing protein [bacterium]